VGTGRRPNEASTGSKGRSPSWASAPRVRRDTGIGSWSDAEMVANREIAVMVRRLGARYAARSVRAANARGRRVLIAARVDTRKEEGLVQRSAGSSAERVPREFSRRSIAYVSTPPATSLTGNPSWARCAFGTPPKGTESAGTTSPFRRTSGPAPDRSASCGTSPRTAQNPASISWPESRIDRLPA